MSSTNAFVYLYSDHVYVPPSPRHYQRYHIAPSIYHVSGEDKLSAHTISVTVTDNHSIFMKDTSVRMLAAVAQHTYDIISTHAFYNLSNLADNKLTVEREREGSMPYPVVKFQFAVRLASLKEIIHRDFI